MLALRRLSMGLLFLLSGAPACAEDCSAVTCAFHGVTISLKEVRDATAEVCITTCKTFEMPRSGVPHQPEPGRVQFQETLADFGVTPPTTPEPSRLEVRYTITARSGEVVASGQGFAALRRGGCCGGWHAKL